MYLFSIIFVAERYRLYGMVE